jgi:hypothetical protein
MSLPAILRFQRISASRLERSMPISTIIRTIAWDLVNVAIAMGVKKSKRISFDITNCDIKDLIS